MGKPLPDYGGSPRNTFTHATAASPDHRSASMSSSVVTPSRAAAHRASNDEKASGDGQSCSAAGTAAEGGVPVAGYESGKGSVSQTEKAILNGNGCNAGAVLYCCYAELSIAELSQQLSDEEPLLMIEIEDTGIGISPEVMVKLFTPFRQAQRMGQVCHINEPIR